MATHQVYRSHRILQKDYTSIDSKRNRIWKLFWNSVYHRKKKMTSKHYKAVIKSTFPLSAVKGKCGILPPCFIIWS